MAAAFAATLIVGCAARPVPPPTPPSADALVLSRSLSNGVLPWSVEVRKRFDNPVIVFVHGVERNGVWWCTPDEGPAMPVESLARVLKKLYGTRPVVLVCCNAGRLHLNVQGVWYSQRGLMWSLPHLPTRENCVDRLVEGTTGLEE